MRYLLQGDNSQIECCALCGRKAHLQHSHILPAFLFRWLKKTGGPIRNSNQPNLRVQDGLKIPLLCSNCESLFNHYETSFANKLFYPYSDDYNHCCRYQEWLIKYCVSVSWRILTYALKQDHVALTDRQKYLAENALLRWSSYLRGECCHPDMYEQHLLLAGPIEELSIPNMPTNAHRYLLRMMHMTLAHSETTLMTYAKMGPFLLFGYIEPPQEKWIGTKIHIKNGLLPCKNYIITRSVFDFIIDQMKMVESFREKISDKQNEIIDQKINDSSDDFKSSKQFEAMILDADLFGIENIKTK